MVVIFHYFVVCDRIVIYHYFEGRKKSVKDFTICVLRRHGVVRESKGVDYIMELVDMHLFHPRDMLMSKIFKDVAHKYGVEKKIIFCSLRGIAQTMRRKNPEWYTQVFSKGFDSYTFVKIISREVMVAYCAYLEGLEAFPCGGPEV